jgi:histidinol dehydrogenase
VSGLIRRLNAERPSFAGDFAALTAMPDERDPALVELVSGIIQRVRREGDDALLELTRQFDRRACTGMDELILTAQQLAAALARIGTPERMALEQAAERIRAYHEHQKAESWLFTDALGNRLGQRVTPLSRAGIYVPGGKASYPSSVLMNALPAKVAGVREIIMTVPAPDGVVNDLVLAAAALAGVDKVVTVGGAQAVAALAYGTASVPAVDKIVGPGNRFVAEAKRQVFGVVGIDMVAGPSEILILADGSVPAKWMAMDLFSQAEHDEQAQAILICHDDDYLDAVEREIARLLPTMERADIISQSLADRGALIKVATVDAAIALSNAIGPEHLELALADAPERIEQIEVAGAIFVGGLTSEALGDYCAGPNHVLPTSGTARFSSPLGVYDFQKRSSVIHCSERGSRELGAIASVLARGESLTAHARSAELRGEKPE